MKKKVKKVKYCENFYRRTTKSVTMYWEYENNYSNILLIDNTNNLINNIKLMSSTKEEKKEFSESKQMKMENNVITMTNL